MFVAASCFISKPMPPFPLQYPSMPFIARNYGTCSRPYPSGPPLPTPVSLSVSSPLKNLTGFFLFLFSVPLDEQYEPATCWIFTGQPGHFFSAYIAHL